MAPCRDIRSAQARRSAIETTARTRGTQDAARSCRACRLSPLSGSSSSAACDASTWIETRRTSHRRELRVPHRSTAAFASFAARSQSWRRRSMRRVASLHGARSLCRLQCRGRPAIIAFTFVPRQTCLRSFVWPSCSTIRSHRLVSRLRLGTSIGAAHFTVVCV